MWHCVWHSDNSVFLEDPGVYLRAGVYSVVVLEDPRRPIFKSSSLSSSLDIKSLPLSLSLKLDSLSLFSSLDIKSLSLSSSLSLKSLTTALSLTSVLPSSDTCPASSRKIFFPFWKFCCLPEAWPPNSVHLWSPYCSVAGFLLQDTTETKHAKTESRIELWYIHYSRVVLECE